MHCLQAINSDLRVFIVGNKTCGTIKGDIYIYVCDVQSESSAHHTIHMPYWDTLPHHCVTNYNITLLNVLMSI